MTFIALNSISINPCKDVEIWMNHKYEMKGYHVLCITIPDDQTINIKIWSRIYTSNPTKIINHPISNLEQQFPKIQALITSIITITNIKWAMFTTNGDIINSYHDFIEVTTNDNLILLYEGGNFMYPGVRINFTRSISINPNSDKEECITYNLKTLSLQPLVFSIDNLITNQESDALLNITYKLLHSSQVENTTYSHWRTSSTAWIDKNIIHEQNEQLSLRIAKLTKLPYENMEDTQVLQYLKGQHYGLHLDFFNNQNGEDRLLTVLWYFNDVNDGGFTIFPMYNKTWIDKIYNLLSIEHCLEIGGLLVKPERGKVILFYNLEPNGEINNYALHGSCPVGEGHVKYAANKWIWNVRQN